MRFLSILSIAVCLATPGAPATAEGDRLATFLTIDALANGITRTSEGRTFLPLSHLDRKTGPQVVEWKQGAPVAFPDATWNGWTPGADATRAFVRVNALRIGPEGALWIVDVGVPGLGGIKVAHGPKIVKVDLMTNQVVRVYDLDSVTQPRSFVDDIRFHGGVAYITDAGVPGVVVLDLKSGAARRVLDGDPSMTAQRPITADDHVLRGPDGKAIRIHADQLEISPDGKFFYYQPASGPMSRIATRYLEDAKLPNAQLAKHVTTFAKTPATGGTAIDADGNIYCSDTNRHRILKISPEGTIETLVGDPRLLWVDAMWIDAQGWLYMPAAQLDRAGVFNGGTSKVQYPIAVYRMQIGARPPPSDHP